MNIINESGLTSQSKLKSRAYEIIRTLTLLDTSITYLDDPIAESNQLLTRIADSVKNITHKNPFVEKIHLYLFSMERGEYYEKLTAYSDQLKNGVIKAKDLHSHLKTSVTNLELLSSQITDDEILKHFQGIISINFLKVATIEQGITFAEKQLNAVDKYRTVSLYHLSDVIQSKKYLKGIDGEAGYRLLSKEFALKEENLSVLNSRLGCILFSSILFSLINYLATNYCLTWASVRYRELSMSNVGFNLSGIDASSKLHQESFEVINSITFMSFGLSFTFLMMVVAFLSIMGFFTLHYLNRDFFKAKNLFFNLSATQVKKEEAPQNNMGEFP
jgi:hypothetical protein